MSDLILYVDTSEVREGALEELKPAIKELVDFVEANEPRLIAYNVYLSDDGTTMTRERSSRLRLLGVPPDGGRSVVSPVQRARHAVLDPHLRRAQRESAETVA
jgi:hypothetical protein